MRAYLIDPAARSITPVDLDSPDAIRAAIGFATIDSDEIDDHGHRLFFDEECFIRALDGAGRFKLDNLAPVQGKGVVIGSRDGSTALADVALTLEALQLRVRFL